MTGINVYGGKCIYQIHKATPDLEILDASFQEKGTNERKQLYTVRIYEIEVICIGEQNRFRFGSLPRSLSLPLFLAGTLSPSFSLSASLSASLSPSLSPSLSLKL